MASEAVGQLGVLGQAFGEGLRVSALTSEIPVALRVSSVTLDRGLFVATGAIVTLVGIVAAPLTLSLIYAWRWYAALFAVTLISLLLVMVLAVQKRWPVLSRSARVARRVRCLRSWLESSHSTIESVENRIFEFHRDAPQTFWASLGLNLVCHGMALFEVYLILWLMGVKITLLVALIFEGLTKLVNVLGVFNPGNIGTYEGGNVLIARMFSLGGGTGLVLAVSRRIRAIFWAAVGAVCLVVMSRGSKSRGLEEENNTPGEIPEETMSHPRSETFCQPTSPSPVAIILANCRQHDGQIDAPLKEVGTLPVVLRTILGVQKAGVRRIFAAVLSLWASILDGCDGEVARLKLLESDFGCWLETICDYLYYLFIFSGRAIGLVRHLGSTYLVWTGLLLFGAVTSFLVTGLGRHRLASDRPEAISEDLADAGGGSANQPYLLYWAAD